MRGRSSWKNRISMIGMDERRPALRHGLPPSSLTPLTLPDKDLEENTAQWKFWPEGAMHLACFIVCSPSDLRGKRSKVLHLCKSNQSPANGRWLRSHMPTKSHFGVVFWSEDERNVRGYETSSKVVHSRTPTMANEVRCRAAAAGVSTTRRDHENLRCTSASGKGSRWGGRARSRVVSRCSSCVRTCRTWVYGGSWCVVCRRGGPRWSAEPVGGS